MIPPGKTPEARVRDWKRCTHCNRFITAPKLDEDLDELCAQCEGDDSVEKPVVPEVW